MDLVNAREARRPQARLPPGRRRQPLTHPAGHRVFPARVHRRQVTKYPTLPAISCLASTSETRGEIVTRRSADEGPVHRPRGGRCRSPRRVHHGDGPTCRGVGPPEERMAGAWLDHPSRHAHIPIRRKSWHMVGDCRIGDRRRRRHRRSVRTTAGALMHLDGFVRGPVEIWVPRSSRNRGHGFVTRSSSRPLLLGDVVTIDGIRCVSAERLILDSLLFDSHQGSAQPVTPAAIATRVQVGDSHNCTRRRRVWPQPCHRDRRPPYSCHPGPAPTRRATPHRTDAARQTSRHLHIRRHLWPTAMDTRNSAISGCHTRRVRPGTKYPAEPDIS